MQLLKYHVSEVHRSENKPGTDSDGVNPSCGPAGPKQRRNKQQVRGVSSSDGWRRFHIKKDGEVKISFSRKEIRGKDKFRCEETSCQVGEELLIRQTLIAGYQDQHREEGITRDGYKKHCYASHHLKICLLRLEVTEEAGEDEKFKCEKCNLLLSREQTYRAHVERCKGCPKKR